MHLYLYIYIYIYTIYLYIYIDTSVSVFYISIACRQIPSLSGRDLRPRILRGQDHLTLTRRGDGSGGAMFPQKPMVTMGKP